MVKVLNASLRSCMGGSLGPGRRGPTAFDVELLLDRIPGNDEYRYKVVQRGIATFYIGLVDGVARFFMHNPRDQSGYGGRVFTGLTEDGDEFAVRGPWSSGPSEINALKVIPPVACASGTADPETFQRGYTFFSLSGVTIDVISQAELLLPGWQYVTADHKRHPASIGASEEQTRAIEHPDGPRSGWSYITSFDPCPRCDGASFVPADPNERGAWKSSRTGNWTKPCPICGMLSCDSGIVPVPGLRWKGAVTR